MIGGVQFILTGVQLAILLAVALKLSRWELEGVSRDASRGPQEQPGDAPGRDN